MMSLLITNNGHMNVKFDPMYLVKDEIMMRLIKDETFRKIFLESLEVKYLIIGRLGKQKQDLTFSYNKTFSQEKSLGKFNKEVGYFAKLQ